MPDVMLPPAASQVAPTQATAKPDRVLAKNPEQSQKTESNQEFSKTLKDRMQTDKGAESKGGAKAKTEEAVENRAGAATPIDMVDGKQLPETGNTEAPPIAALVPEAPLPAQPLTSLTEAEPAPASVPVVLESEPAATGLAPLAVTVGEPPSGPVKLEPAIGRQGPQNPQAQYPFAAKTAPEMVQSTVAQAVRDALSERDALALTQQFQQRLGAEVRAFAHAQQRGTGFEAMLERVTPPQQGHTSSTLPQALQGVMPQDANVAAARPVLPTTTLATPFRQPGWDQALSERVLWAASQKLQSAEIRLNPPNLGPIEVRVHMQQDQAQVSFTAQHAVVREALEASMPRLREMLNANGFNLVDVDVSQHSFADQQRHAQGFAAPSGNPGGGDDSVTMGATPPLELPRVGELSRSGIDLFA